MESFKKRTQRLEVQVQPETEKVIAAWMRALKGLDVKDLAVFLKLVASPPDGIDDDYHCPVCRNHLTLEQLKDLSKGV